MSRRRNILVRTERTQALDAVFAAKAESFEYKDDAYVLHFTKPTTVNQVQIWSNCPNVEPLVKGKKRPIPDSVYKSVLKAQSEYRSLVERGKSIDIILRKCGISEDVLQPRQTRALKIFRRKLQEQQEAKHAMEKAEEEERRNEEERDYRRKVKQAEEARRKKKDDVRKTDTSKVENSMTDRKTTESDNMDCQ